MFSFENFKVRVVLLSQGGTHIFGRTGMCRPNESLFYKKSLNMGPIFYPKKSLNMGQLFWLSPKLRDFRGFRMAKTPKMAEFLKNRPIFEGKSLKMGTLFGQNHPLRWVWVLRLEWHTPVQLKSEYPPPGLLYVQQKTFHPVFQNLGRLIDTLVNWGHIKILLPGLKFW